MRSRNIAASVLLLAGLLLSGAKDALGCGCVGVGGKRTIFEIATSQLNYSTAVFSGKVVRFEWRKGIPNEGRLDHQQQFGGALDWETKVAILKVDKWWKPSLPEEVALVTEEVRMSDGTSGNSSCNFNFVDGKTYLVFANGPENELRTDSCAPTRSLDSVSKEFLDALGKGNEPIKKFEAEKPKQTSRLLFDRNFFTAG